MESHHIAVRRVEALTDTVFALSMVLLVLRLDVPRVSNVLSESELRSALLEMSPRLYVYAISFVFLLVYWVLHHYQFRHLTRSSGRLVWLTGPLLAAVALVPFTTELLAEYRVLTTSVALYEANLLVIQLLLLFTWSNAVRSGLMFGADVPSGIVRRMRVALTLGAGYIAVAVGLAFIGPYVSLNVLLGLGVFYAILTARGGYSLDVLRHRPPSED